MRQLFPVLLALCCCASLSQQDFLDPKIWCCLLNVEDAKVYKMCDNIDCSVTTTASTTTTTTTTTTTPPIVKPVVLDPEIVKESGNDTRTESQMLSSSQLFEGDVLGVEKDAEVNVNDMGQNFVNKDELKWRDATIPYVLSRVYRPQDRAIIQRAIEDFMSKTPIKFRPRKDEDKDYVYIGPGFGCSSHIGHQQGRQIINLQVPGCMKRGVIQHELMHATGFYHEQSRTDRDQYVEINWDNIRKADYLQFRSYSDKDITAFGRPYDFASILHYGKNDFAINADEWTIRPRENVSDSPGADQMGQREGLSKIDLEKIKLAYPEKTVSLQVEDVQRQVVGSHLTNFATSSPSFPMALPKKRSPMPTCSAGRTMPGCQANPMTE
ncbi:zinc metalloproteinase nas-4-like isoform X2 [Paramacrobiotus metropolitanus]|uniref:zinc metalloproteinase nas-4-like isoform X2 n=1 Tax=Paramacrobiotus metropolitanus TaxID=2943436 RepID=UPI0024458E1F|nr:zinc metalloproteinase nas-4-like isoform X2 [Paramacrobiotus metropolitanus]